MSTECNSDNCDLCLNNKKTECITCKFNYNLIKENHTISKICDEERKTDIITEITTESITDKIIDKISDKVADLTTELIMNTEIKEITTELFSE